MKEKRQLEVLYQISRALVGKQDLDAILQQVVSMTAELAGSRICSLMLINDKKDELVIRATQSLSTAYRDKPPIKIGQSISGKVVEKKHPIQVANVTEDPAYRYPEIARQEGLKSLLSVPLLLSDKIIGVLNCYTEEVKIFSKEEIQLVQTIANQVAMVIEHGRMVLEEAEARLALETKKVIDNAKRVLMKRHKMSEEDAHRFIQKASMDKNRPQKEIADAIILSVELIK
jgi:signal transduction protein with GAF and PtsI domain